MGKTASSKAKHSAPSPTARPDDADHVRDYLLKAEAMIAIMPMLTRDGGEPHETRRKIQLTIPVEPARAQATRAYCERKFALDVFFGQRYSVKLDSTKMQVIVFTRTWTGKVLKNALVHFKKVCPEAKLCPETVGADASEAALKHASTFVKAIVHETTDRSISIFGKDLYHPMEVLHKVMPEVPTYWDKGNMARKYTGDRSVQERIKDFFAAHDVEVVEDDVQSVDTPPLTPEDA